MSFPSPSQGCHDADIDLTAEFCRVARDGPALIDAMEWCRNPNPTKSLVCGGTDCGVPAKGNACEQRSVGGRMVIATCPTKPNPTPSPTPKPTPPMPVPTKKQPSGGDKIKVVFRLDDVQSFWTQVTQAQVGLLNAFDNEGVKLNAGVVADASATVKGGAVGGAIVAKLAKGNALELFNHGKDGRTALEGHSEAAMRLVVSDTQAFIRATFGVTASAFVPHQNRWDDNLVKALVANGMSVLSTSAAQGGSCGAAGGLVRAKAGAATVWRPTVGQTAQPARTVYAEIQAQARECGFAVVMMHPQEYATTAGGINAESFTRLRELFDLVKADSSMEPAFFSELA